MHDAAALAEFEPFDIAHFAINTRAAVRKKAGKYRRLTSVGLGPTWALLVASGCQGGYPIPASQCDEWCDAVLIPCVDQFSLDEDPAQCVRDCIRHGGDASECQLEHDAAVACLHAPSSTEPGCSIEHGQGLPRVCDDEQTAYEACAARHAPQGLGGPGWYD